MRRFSILLTLLLSATSYGWGAYSNYYSEPNVNASFNWSAWTQNGTVTIGNHFNTGVANGLCPGSSYYGSLISNVTVPDGSSDYMVRIRAVSGSTSHFAQIFLRASADTLITPSSKTGTYYRFYIFGSQITAEKRVGGVTYSLGWVDVGPVQSTDYFWAYAKGNQLYAGREGGPGIAITDSSIASGKPGLGFWYAPAMGTVIDQVYLGPIDRIAPNPIISSSIKTSSFANRVDMQWTGTDDDLNGTGVRRVEMSRDGTLLSSISSNTFSDNTVSPATSYTYAITSYDLHNNSTTTSFSVTTPPAGSIDPRRVGIRPNGAYWGAKGEQIDLLSGNVNFTLPLLTAQSRGGRTLPLGLSYNSQNWRQDPGGTWRLGNDVGYGFGWRLQAGSLTPYWSDYFTIHHYTFTDATGAEYRLDVNNSGVWTSNQGVYMSYDANTARLYFNDGSFWAFDSLSGINEQDAGTRYPTLIQDSNGNQIKIRYGGATPNTSARITEVEDVRAVDVGGGVRRTYLFTWDASGYLTGITNSINSAESYTFSYSNSQILTSPFGGSFGNVRFLQSVLVNNLSLSHTFTTDSSGMLTKVTLPYGGYLRWQHSTYTYLGTRTQPEVQNRYLSADGTNEALFALSRDTTDTGRTVHNYAFLTDPSGNGEQRWYFDTNTASSTIGLALYNEARQGSTVKARTDYTWAGSLLTTLKSTIDPGASQVYKNTKFTYDSYGNLTKLDDFPFNTLTTSSSRARTLTYTYLTNPSYTSRYIRNRRASTQVDRYGYDAPVTLETIAYDDQATAPCDSYATLASVSSPYEHDTSSYGTGFLYRGNPTMVSNLNGISCAAYDIVGNSPTQLDMQGRVHNTSFSYNFAAPSSGNMGIYSQSMQWNSFLGLTQSTSLDGTVTTQYDALTARPTQTTSPEGVVTSFTYTTSPPTVTATTNGRWSKTTLDGLGRVAKVEVGNASGTESVAETEYTTAGVSPMGAVLRTSSPHAPTAPARWTTYAYDGLGRTSSILAADGASTAAYTYLANTVTVTDPAGKWKQLTMDELGRITKVTEPNPAGGTWDTNYQYTLLGQLKQVSMPRPTGTQTRTFTYNGVRLIQATVPETGTTSYYYDQYGRLSYWIDAKGQKILFNYDSLGRLTYRQTFPDGVNENSCEGISFYYDQGVTIYVTGAFQFQNVAGRLAFARYNPGCVNGDVYEFYSYTSTGKLNRKELFKGAWGPYSYPAWSRIRAEMTYDSEGRLSTLTYPNGGPTYTYTYDAMGRPSGMNNGATPVVSNLSYGPAGELLTMTYGGYNETRSYNVLNQLTRLTDTPTAGGSPVIDFEYKFSPTQNNGKITGMKDWVTGEDVVYAYDALNRLLSAQTVGPEWGQSFTFDGFNNLLQQTVTKGSAFNYSVAVNPANNRLTGATYDANGNDLTFGTYDSMNRLLTASGAQYGYDNGNKRVLKKNPDGSQEYYFYLGDQRLGAYRFTAYPSYTITTLSTNVYFGGKLISSGGNTVLTDRLGSNVTGGKRYFPWGQEKPSGTTNNVEKFTGYFRDPESGLDYADQRYHAPGTGRFITSDPIGDGRNWYSYAGGDPVNNTDPTGLCMRTDQPCDWERIASSTAMVFTGGAGTAAGLAAGVPTGGLGALFAGGFMTSSMVTFSVGVVDLTAALVDSPKYDVSTPVSLAAFPVSIPAAAIEVGLTGNVGPLTEFASSTGSLVSSYQGVIEWLPKASQSLAAAAGNVIDFIGSQASFALDLGGLASSLANWIAAPSTTAPEPPSPPAPWAVNTWANNYEYQMWYDTWVTGYFPSSTPPYTPLYFPGSPTNVPTQHCTVVVTETSMKTKCSW